MLLALCSFADAQQPAKIPQVGLVVADRETTSAREFQKGCASSVISRGKTSGLSIATIET